MDRKLIKTYINELFQSYRRGTISNVQGQNVIHHGDFIRTQTASRLGGYPVKIAGDAACAVVVGKNNQILAVSRPNDPTDFGFPGGMIEDGEDPATAALRELAEETGVQGHSPVQLASLRGSDGRKVHFYACEGEGEVGTDEHGIVKWVSPDELLAGQFGNEARIILSLIGLHI